MSDIAPSHTQKQQFFGLTYTQPHGLVDAMRLIILRAMITDLGGAVEMLTLLDRIQIVNTADDEAALAKRISGKRGVVVSFLNQHAFNLAYNNVAFRRELGASDVLELTLLLHPLDEDTVRHARFNAEQLAADFDCMFGGLLTKGSNSFRDFLQLSLGYCGFLQHGLPLLYRDLVDRPYPRYAVSRPRTGSPVQRQRSLPCPQYAHQMTALVHSVILRSPSLPLKRKKG